MYEMELEEAIRYIHENPEVYLTPTGKKGGGYICPICGSGSGPHKTGIVSDKTESWKFTCFAGDCFKKSDVINIIGIKEHLDNKEALFRAFEIYGIELKKNGQYQQKNFEPQKRSSANKEEIEALAKIEEARIIEDIKAAEENLWQASGEYKDANEALIADKLTFEKRVKESNSITNNKRRCMYVFGRASASDFRDVGGYGKSKG